MIIVTGGAGFIGSNIVKKLNKDGYTDIVIVDDLDNSEKWKNLVDLRYISYVDYQRFFDYARYLRNIDVIIHMGACSNTMEKDSKYLMDTNFEFSKQLYDLCSIKQTKLIYASSAAVYGNGELGYFDNETDKYKPLNIYGYTKKLFDQYVLNSGLQELKQCVGLRFFNVYGPNEAHKGKMASVIYHAYNQIKETGTLNLFKSYKDNIPHGEQQRDFIYVNDVVNVVIWMINHPNVNGIFNVGTGTARSYNDLALAVFKAMKVKSNIFYIDMPEDLREKYQYFTQALMSKLYNAGYDIPFTKLEDGIKDYIEILEKEK